MNTTKTALTIALLAAFPLAQAQVGAAPTVRTTAGPSAQPEAAVQYAQYLVARTRAAHPELLGVDIRAAPPAAAQSLIIASLVTERVGRASLPEDIAVLASGQPRIEINRRGDQNVDVELPLFDLYKRTIGSVEFTFPYPPGADREALVAKAGQYRDEMSRHIRSLASLVEPVQLDPGIPTHTLAQSLVDAALRRHPGVEVIAVRAQVAGSASAYPIVASNMGHIGAAADDSYLEVARTGTTVNVVNEQASRFESKVALRDVAGATVGVVTVVFPYTSRSDPAMLQRQAERIAAELGERIPSAASLVAAAPAGPAAEGAMALDEYNRQELGNKQELPMTKEIASGEALGQTQEGYSDAIKNQAGVQATNSAGNSNDAFAMRGIKLNLFANYRLDGGLPVAGVLTNPTENKARVETLKGANALMFGVASPAGIINFVTKRAGLRDVTTAGFAGNSFGQYGASVDIGRRFGADKQFGVRLNASALHLENGVHDSSGEGYFASVGADWRVSPNLTLQADLEHYRREVPEQAGISLLPVNSTTGVIPITRVPDPRHLLSGSWNVYTPQTTNVQLRADYAFSDRWKMLVQAGQSDAHRHRNTVRIGGYDPVTGGNGTVTVQPITNDYRNTFGRTEMLGHFGTWGITHDLTLGLSSSARYGVSYDTNNVKLPQKQNIFEPIVLDPPVFTKANVDKPAQTSTDSGLYAYDTIGVTPKLKLLLGVRRVQDKEEVEGSPSSTSYVTSPGYGVLYDVLPTTTLFASSMQGLEAGATAPANAANASEILAPAVSKQKEIGVRNSYVKGLSVSASYFTITRGNAVTDPTDNVFKYLGDLEYKGVEATSAYQINRDWKVHAALLRLQAIQHSPAQPLIDSKVPENSPKWNANFGVAYRVASFPGLSIKGGVKLISQRPVNNQDQGYIPGYALYDAGLSYATHVAGRKASFGLNVDNLANRRYWNSVQTGTYGIGMDRSIKFNAKVDF